MFSFGIVCISAVLKEVLFHVAQSEIKQEGLDRPQVIFLRQVSFFTDIDGLAGFLNHLGREHPWRDMIADIRDIMVNCDQHRQSFASWEDVDEDFKDLVGKLTNFDPLKRITAGDALKHPWFKTNNDPGSSAKKEHA